MNIETNKLKDKDTLYREKHCMKKFYELLREYAKIVEFEKNKM